MRPTILIVAFSICLLPHVATAQWQTNGVRISNAPGSQYPTIVEDGAGGAIITWHDNRNGPNNADIYIQRVNASGVPLWGIGGVGICNAAGNQYQPVIVSDDAGGAIVTWNDARNGTNNHDIYVQRVDGFGAPLWTGDGVALCTAAEDQRLPEMVSDGSGGAIVTWHDERSGTNSDIYVQRVDDTGAPLWRPDGEALCTEPSYIYGRLTITTDGAGGAIVAWTDQRNADQDIYMQHVAGDGVPHWTTDGVAVCTAAYYQTEPSIVSDGGGGAIVAWNDHRTLSNYTDIYVQRMDADGNPKWALDGEALCTAALYQLDPTITSDHAGGAIVAWHDGRNAGQYDIYTQRVDNSGVPLWTADGVALCTAADDQRYTKIDSDGAGGAIVTWEDQRDAATIQGQDVYAQRVDNSGVPQWTTDGVAVCTALYFQFSPVIVSDGAGGGIATWYDIRSWVSDEVYAQRILASGDLPTAVNRPTGTPALIVAQVHPNPFAGTAWMEIQVPTPSLLEIDVYDVAGRAVRSLTVPDVVGSRRVALDDRDATGALLPSGVYFCRVKAAGETTTRKMVIAR